MDLSFSIEMSNVIKLSASDDLKFRTSHKPKCFRPYTNLIFEKSRKIMEIGILFITLLIEFGNVALLLRNAVRSVHI